MIVVDTNVIAYLFLPGERTDSAERLLKKDAEWSAPLLWRSEFRNVLAGYLRRDLTDLRTAFQIMTQAEDLLRGREFSVSSSDVLRQVASSRCSAYDCEFVVLAEDLGVSLVTTDKQVLREFPLVARSLVGYAAVR